MHAFPRSLPGSSPGPLPRHAERKRPSHPHTSAYSCISRRLRTQRVSQTLTHAGACPPSNEPRRPDRFPQRTRHVYAIGCDYDELSLNRHEPRQCLVAAMSLLITNPRCGCDFGSLPGTAVRRSHMQLVVARRPPRSPPPSTQTPPQYPIQLRAGMIGPNSSRKGPWARVAQARIGAVDATVSQTGSRLQDGCGCHGNRACSF